MLDLDDLKGFRFNAHLHPRAHRYTKREIEISTHTLFANTSFKLTQLFICTPVSSGHETEKANSRYLTEIS